MPYDRRTYARDTKRAWAQAKPQLIKGLASPFRVAIDKKSPVVTELRNWLVLFLLSIPRLLLKIILYSIRLALKK